MNNFIGAGLLTITILLVLSIYFLYNKPQKNKNNFVVSQSMLQHRYSNITGEPRRLKVKTQSKNHHQKMNLKIIILDNNAYWIKDNIFYKAPMVNEHVDHEYAEQVDTISMNKVQLEQMLFIMDKLREGIEDDSRSSGD